LAKPSSGRDDILAAMNRVLGATSIICLILSACLLTGYLFRTELSVECSGPAVATPPYALRSVALEEGRMRILAAGANPIFQHASRWRFRGPSFRGTELRLAIWEFDGHVMIRGSPSTVISHFR
jgi:hypothetical protein